MREEELLKHFDEMWNSAITGDTWKLNQDMQKVYEQIRSLIEVDVHELIQAVLDHAKCHHTLEHDEDGVRSVPEFDVDDKCHEAVRKVLGVEK